MQHKIRSKEQTKRIWQCPQVTAATIAAMFLKLLQKIRNSKRAANSPSKENLTKKVTKMKLKNTPTTSTKPTSEAKILPASNTDTKSR